MTVDLTSDNIISQNDTQRYSSHRNKTKSNQVKTRSPRQLDQNSIIRSPGHLRPDQSGSSCHQKWLNFNCGWPTRRLLFLNTIRYIFLSLPIFFLQISVKSYTLFRIALLTNNVITRRFKEWIIFSMSKQRKNTKQREEIIIIIKSWEVLLKRHKAHRSWLEKDTDKVSIIC